MQAIRKLTFRGFLMMFPGIIIPTYLFVKLKSWFSKSCLPAEEPSMCYYYDGDGVCEDFERETGVRDCGLYTPSGFLDQWAATVEVSHEQKPYCSGEVAAGYPAVKKVGPHL